MHRGSLSSLAIVLAALGTSCHATPDVRPVGDEPTLAVLGTSGIACGAVAVSPSLAVTANHCAPEDVVAYLTAPREAKNARTGYGFVVARDPASDLAVFATEHLVPAELAREPLELEHVSSMVAHVPKPWGIVAVQPRDVDAGFVRTARLHVGASGSGLWDAEWRLVGVAVGNDNQSGYFASVARIRALMGAIPHAPRSAASSSDVEQPKSSPSTTSLKTRLARRALASPSAEVDVQGLLEAARAKRERIDAELTRLRPRPRQKPESTGN